MSNDTREALAAEATNLAGVLRGMIECGSAPDDLWERDQPDGDPFVARAAELLEHFAAQPTRVDWQQRCVEAGFEYWRASDAHGVTCTKAQATTLLEQLLGVEVEIHAAPAAPAQEPQQPVPAAVQLAMSVARDGYLSMRATGQACLPEFTENAIAALDAAIAASSPAPAVHPDVSAERRLRRLITAPAPAVQPTEAVAELVEALRAVVADNTYGEPPSTELPSLSRARALIAKHGQPQPNAPRFTMTYCSQCGQELGSGNSGVSHCSEHVSGGSNG